MIANVQHWTELISKKLSGNIRPDEARMLEEWVARDPEHQEYYEHLVRLWKVTGSAAVETPPVEGQWDEMENLLKKPAHKVHLPQIHLPEISVRKIGMRNIAAAAAVLLIGILSITLLTHRQSATEQEIVSVPESQELEEVLLPDGSKVTLRKGSTLQYSEDFIVRDVTLSGEAFFEVTHDEERPFSVNAGNATVRVLGTKFNVRAVPEEAVELVVKEGRVAFAPGDRKYDAKIFTAGQAGILEPANDADVERTASPGQNITSWITGNLTFDHATLDHVLADISHHFSVSIEAADTALYGCELKADFDHATLENVLETLRFSLNLEIEKTGEKYIVNGEPCATQSEN